jgi:hypothetical protein
MTDINSLMEDIAIAALETNVKIASLALISESGQLLYQTQNWDLSTQTKVILDVVKGNKKFVLNGLTLSVIGKDPSRIVATNNMGMGSIVILPFHGGSLISYVMPGADTEAALDFLVPYAIKISEIL